MIEVAINLIKYLYGELIMKYVVWRGKFPTSALGEIYELTNRIKGKHEIKYVGDGEIELISHSAVEMSTAIHSNMFLSRIVR